ncbi:MAG: hypothetical protein JSR80_00490, partial [Verrucomicrobia bacterium]|nr:hypothetical protein [Verrucomicrobiota bacterium]
MSRVLADRAVMLAAARHFFSKRGVMEVDCSALRLYPTADAHIEPLRAGNFYLHTSPEYAMKTLLCLGSGDIYQLGHVFRANEEGRRHRPEFTLAEWYRLGFSLQQMIDETIAFAELFIGPRPVQQFSYAEAFARFAPNDERDPHLVLATVIEPAFDPHFFTVITDFPPHEAALAQIHQGVAKRFELFCEGLELANGYFELEDPQEYRLRGVGDEELLAALEERGLPPCSGVAVGFDRLMMARHATDDIKDVLHDFTQELYQ